MTKSLTSTLAAALIASATFGGAALADGDYYEGASKTTEASRIDRVQTGSIGDRAGYADQDVRQTPDRGDYYEGANRPN
ncbi:hypothetical protein [Pseudorhizobium flavum]|jgi:hypothetical protein|uniref:hypothetical protein n=1 Tax=Pseudorhizobium flavum TaxID=1335061 RepID=UPI003770273B